MRLWGDSMKKISTIKITQTAMVSAVALVFSFIEMSMPDIPFVLPGMKPDDLSVIRAGFRHRYIIDAAKKVATHEVDLEKLRELSYDDAKKELMKITGVGVKVADCVLLFGFHRLESFPLDVWMKRAMEVLFDNMNPDVFGQYGGIAQQYIFHYSRMHKELFE